MNTNRNKMGGVGIYLVVIAVIAVLYFALARLSPSSSSSSSSSSYDEGSDDAYSGDYDENRYDNDESYRDGVDDMLDELGE